MLQEQVFPSLVSLEAVMHPQPSDPELCMEPRMERHAVLMALTEFRAYRIEFGPRASGVRAFVEQYRRSRTISRPMCTTPKLKTWTFSSAIMVYSLRFMV